MIKAVATFYGRLSGAIGVDYIIRTNVNVNPSTDSDEDLLEAVINALYCDYEHIWVKHIETDTKIYTCPALAAKGYWKTK